MYINKGIYTYIPIPDPETPKPEARWPDPELVFQGTGEQLFGLFFYQCKNQQDI